MYTHIESGTLYGKELEENTFIGRYCTLDASGIITTSQSPAPPTQTILNETSVHLRSMRRVINPRSHACLSILGFFPPSFHVSENDEYIHPLRSTDGCILRKENRRHIANVYSR